MRWGVVLLGAVLVASLALLIYLTRLLFSRSFPRISRSGLFSFWMMVFGLTSLVLAGLVLLLRHG